jgi:hypothetical protein
MDEGGVLELLLLASLSAVAFRHIRFPYIVVDSESLFNDAAAMALFPTILSAINSDVRGPVIVVHGALNFVWVSLGGLGR